MKASELKKKSYPIEDIYEMIKSCNEQGEFKTFISHYCFVSEDVKLQLINDGFKCYVGDWDGIQLNAFIIEW